MTQIAARRFLVDENKLRSRGRMFSPWWKASPRVAPYQGSYIPVLFVFSLHSFRMGKHTHTHAHTQATGTRLPGVHNYRALTHKNARFLPTGLDSLGRPSLPLFSSSVFVPAVVLGGCWVLTESPTNTSHSRVRPRVPRSGKGSQGGPVRTRSPLRDPASLLSYPSWSPSGRASVGSRRRFDLWIPQRRHRDDQSSNYGRIPHTSPVIKRPGSGQSRRITRDIVFLSV